MMTVIIINDTIGEYNWCQVANIVIAVLILCSIRINCSDTHFLVQIR